MNALISVPQNDPKYKERCNTRNSILDQYGKVLPRVQRRLVTERVKPYHHPSTIHREVSRPQPLSTLAKRSAAENVLTRANFISNVLTKIGEVWEGKDGKPEPSPLKSPSASGLPLTSSHHPSTDLAEAFVGTPIKITSKRMTRILNLIARPSAQMSPEGLGLLQTPTTEVITRSMPSPVPAFSLKPSSLRGTAPELSLLQTPQVVKRARALAPTGPVFPGFTPQSILRSSLRPTPVGSPSASPGRSTTPPSRPKESRITFIEESKSTCHWSNGISAENGIRPLSCTSPLTKLGVEGWMGQPPEQEDEEEEEDVFTFVPQAQLLREVHESEEVGESCSSVHEVVEGKEEDVVGVAEISDASTHYIDTMMELHDTPTLEDPEEQEIEVVVVNVKPEVFPLFPICTGRQEQYEAPGEQEDVEPNFREVEAEVGLEFAEPNLGLEVLGPNLGQAVEEPDLRKVSGELDLGHVAGEPELGQEAGEPDLVQETFEADPGQEEGEPELGQEAGEPELGQEAFESDLGQDAWEPVLVQETFEADPGQEEGEPELGQEVGESDLGQEASEPDLGQEASEPDLGQEVSEPDLGQEAAEPDLKQEAGESDLRQEASVPDLRQEASVPDLGQEEGEPDLRQEASEPDLRQEASEPDLGQEASEPDLGQEASEPDLGQEASEPDLGQEASEPDLGQEASESDLGQEASEPDLGQEASEPDLGQEAPEPDLGQGAPEPDLGQGAPEPDLGQGAPEPDLGQGAPEPDLGQEAPEPDLGQEAPEPDLGQEAPEPDLGQEAPEPDLGQEAPEPDLGQEAPEPDLGQEAPEPDLGQEAPEPDLGQEASEPDLGQEVSEPCVAEQIPVKEEAEPMLEQEEAEPMLEQEKAEQIPKQEDAGKSPELEEVEQNLEQEEMEKRSPEQAQMQYSLEQEEAKQCTEHIGLDEFVEHHLFGNDLSAPLTRSSIRQASQAWATSSDSECSFDARKEAAVTVGPFSPVLTSQKSVTSVSSGAATTTDSHSVVSLNDSEELSRASSEEDSDTTAEEEDSESDVEIIEEVDCNECQKQPQQEPPLGQGYLQEQASAVLSVLTPDVQLEVTTPFNFQQAVGAVGEEEELDIVDLEAQDREEPMCYTELRPSDTLLVPLEPVDEQHLDLHKLEDAREPEVPYTDGSDGLTLMLEAESLENRLTESLKDSDGPLLIMHLPHPGRTQLQQHVCSQEVLCLNKVNADSCEGMSLLPAQPCGLMTQPSKELAIMETNDEELLHNVVSTSQEPIHCEAQMVEEGLMLIKSKGLAISTKESKAIRVVEEPDEKRKKEGSACLLEEETTRLISEVKLAPSGEESESDFVVQVAEPGPVMEVVVPVPVVKGVEHVPAVVTVELATVFEQAEPTIVEEEAQPGTLTEEAVSRAVVEEVESGAVVEEAVTGAVVEEAESGAVVESPAVFEEVTPALVVKEAEPAPEVEEMDSVPVYSGVHLGVNSDQPRPTKSMEEAELRDTSVDVGSKIRCAAATEKHWTTRQRKTITFPSPRDEAKSNMQSAEEKPTRITRQTKHEQDSQILLTPRRSTRIGIEPTPQKEDKAIDSKTKSTKKQTPQKTPPRRGTRRTRNSHLNIEDIQDTEESIEIELPSLPSSRTRMSVMEVPESETPALLEAKAEPLRSSGMMTRKSSRGLFLALETTQDQIMRSEREGATPKMSQRTVSRGSVVEQCKGSSAAAEELPPPNISRRMTRSSLCTHLAASKGEEKEEHLILRTPLNVETEVANALMERLKDEVAKGSRGRETSDSGTTIVRARKRGTRAPSPPFAMAEELLLDRRGRGLEADMKNQTQSKAQLASRRTRVSKASETDSSPPRDSFLSSPPQTRRKIKGDATASLQNRTRSRKERQHLAKRTFHETL
ncbi:hypothetical protein SKAU_G00194280 [Synaphobranchus kaupii]|uniref:Uncharacterized protein n=1 Tax=Synaphobranchus kaupii TaxID=118154 RepID=A0A9Q1IWN7_SYNKA|nr:hypothetical protein SKAU_G00194280 [Synaphobranchus kaupii]